MARTQIEQKLFQNNGNGPLLNAGIVPAPVLPTAGPTQAGVVYSGATAGRVYVSGNSSYAFALPAAASEILSGTPGANRNGFPAMVDIVGLKPVLDEKAPIPQYSAGIGQWVSITNTTIGGPLVLPAGGTWAYSFSAWNGSTYLYGGNYSNVAAGGTTIGVGSANYNYRGFAWRIA